MFKVMGQKKPEFRRSDIPSMPGNQPQVLDRVEPEDVADRWVIEYQRRYGHEWNVCKETE